MSNSHPLHFSNSQNIFHEKASGSPVVRHSFGMPPNKLLPPRYHSDTQTGTIHNLFNMRQALNILWFCTQIPKKTNTAHLPSTCRY